MRFVSRINHGKKQLIPEFLCSNDPDLQPIGKLPRHEPLSLLPDYHYSSELQTVLAGKMLLVDELPFSMTVLYEHYLHGFIHFQSGLVKERQYFTCQRCGNEKQRLFAQFPCYRCKSDCTYCRKCIQMGRVSFCTPLIGWTGPAISYEISINESRHTKMCAKQLSSTAEPRTKDEIYITNIETPSIEAKEATTKWKTPSTNVIETSTNCEMLANKTEELSSKVLSPSIHIKKSTKAPISLTKINAPPTQITESGLYRDSFLLSWDGKLSTGQQSASEAVIKAIKQNSELLVWAVCGAGKTEVLFQGLEVGLKAGKIGCIATPRSDVVHELTVRIRSAFPKTKIVSLYGGSSEIFQAGQLVITTTHQLIRYKNHFDFMIIDEVDAFPYSTDEMLQFAASTARKPSSTLIYLTATPSNTLKKRMIYDQLPTITIPARFHRHPLPVPRLQWCGNWKKRLSRGRLPSVVLKWIINHLSDNKQALLFVSEIDVLPNLISNLQKINPEITSVHSADNDRMKKVQAFRDGKVPLLLTTTILERGVTISNIDVAVLGADEQIFTESALVQISGRVGRDRKYPNGDIVFFHFGKTKAMQRAKKQIISMNVKAQKQGLLGGVQHE